MMLQRLVGCLCGFETRSNMRSSGSSRDVRLHDLTHDGTSRQGNSAEKDNGAGQESKCASLVGGSQPCRDHVDKRADTEGDLECH